MFAEITWQYEPTLGRKHSSFGKGVSEEKIKM
jgi:hypothetical protein